MQTKFEENVRQHITEQKQVSLAAFSAPTYENKMSVREADWEDYLWIATDPVTRQLRNFWFTHPIVKKPRKTTAYQNNALLPELAADVAKSYALDVIMKWGVKDSTRVKVREAVKLLATCHGKIWDLTNEALDKVVNDINNTCALIKLRGFITYCHDHEFLPRSVRVNRVIEVDTSAEEKIRRAKQKMPDEQNIKALGAIFHSVVPHNEIDINPLDMVRDCFVLCMSALALGSPNRMAAEQLMLIKQQLQSTQVTTSELNENNEIVKEKSTVHWLNWGGSKGYKDNRNHILAGMVPFVERAVSYLNIVCEPARVLARFYERPDSRLKDILQEFKPKLLHGLSLDEPVHLFQLGGLLGFYDDLPEVRSNIEGFPFISATTKIHVGIEQINQLFGVRQSRPKFIPLSCYKTTVSLQTLQNQWIAYIKTRLPSFPHRPHENGHKVKLKQALSVFTGQQLANGTVGYPMGKSFFAIESTGLKRVIANDLKSSTKGTQSLFSRHGFSDEFALTPHQLRHYMNTMAQRANIPEEVIAMWSGRTSVEENATYDHTTDEENIAKVAQLHHSNEQKPIKVITKEMYEETTGKAAHLMSTGVCTQQLHQQPCTYLNDFMTQCVGCRSSCHINRDKESIDLLEKDLTLQERRLEQVKDNPSLYTNPIMQSWYRHHHTNVYVLSQLIEMMKSHDIKAGSLIRYAGDESAFQLIDLENKQRIEHKIMLPDSQQALDELLLEFNQAETPSVNNELDNLLGSFGVTI